MSDIFNPKLKVKFLREITINNTPLSPGNLLINIDTGRMYMDILSSDNTVKRVNLSGGVNWMGTVSTYNDLLNIEASNGDMYNVSDTGANYIWSKAEGVWDKFSENIDLSGFYTKTEINSTFVPESSLQELISIIDEAASEVDGNS